MILPETRPLMLIKKHRSILVTAIIAEMISMVITSRSVCVFVYPFVDKSEDMDYNRYRNKTDQGSL